MVIIGIILMVAGAFSAIYGVTQNSSLEAQLGSLLSSGSVNPGTPWIVIGVIALLVGLVLLIMGLRKKKND